MAVHVGNIVRSELRDCCAEPSMKRTVFESVQGDVGKIASGKTVVAVFLIVCAALVSTSSANAPVNCE